MSRRWVCGMRVSGLVLLGAVAPMGAAHAADADAGARVVAAVAPSPSASPSASATGAPVSEAGPRLGFSGPFAQIETGGQIWIGLEGMPEGWKEAVVSSPALAEPVPFVPEPGGQPGTGRAADPARTYRVRADIAPGTYPVTASSEGRTVATATLTVIEPGSADITRFVLGPRGKFIGGDASVAVRPGAEALVVLTDYRAADGERSVVVKSPVFDGPVTLTRNSPEDPGCKCDDGGTVYAGHGRVRRATAAGTYPMTAVSHHGKETTTRQVTIAGDPVPDRMPWLIGGAGAAALLVLAAVTGTVFARRRRNKGPDAA
ncbi:hypothetical protein OHS33_28935 [Streptomyces sp. NBC_00536]|uniref:hypothetical protein n=1 Tax=Streptomyces sp. NBC_00536 TaxID=2975769 RepID=UPI002E8242D4|nr:hypothetical protein [Streptomyces sp. NBC_00536]WUC82015.1 hypothetical protein OHS33_28935 [Streptomyces sp. NBC_00536]